MDQAPKSAVKERGKKEQKREGESNWTKNATVSKIMITMTVTAGNKFVSLGNSNHITLR